MPVLYRLLINKFNIVLFQMDILENKIMTTKKDNNDIKLYLNQKWSKISVTTYQLQLPTTFLPINDTLDFIEPMMMIT